MPPHAPVISIPTVLIFWTFVEIAGRGNWYREFWIYPLHYRKEVTATGFLLPVLATVLLWKGRHK